MRALPDNESNGLVIIGLISAWRRQLNKLLLDILKTGAMYLILSKRWVWK
jgi:hypothetical protein